jgi:hypothetical protein
MKYFLETMPAKILVVLALLASCEALPSPATSTPPPTLRRGNNLVLLHRDIQAQRTGELQERLRGGSASAWNPDKTFNAYFGGLALGVAGVRLASRAGKAGGNAQTKEATKSAGFLSLQRRFLAVFWLWKLADWLHGPYFYEVCIATDRLAHPGMPTFFSVV